MDQTRLSNEGYQSILTTRIPKAREDHPQESYRIGDIIAERYEVLAIHRGSMGVVYGAFDREEMLPVALKTLQRRFAVDVNMRRLFAEEAAVWVNLGSHPYVIRAYLVERFDFQPYVITDYVRGPECMGADLRAWLGHPRLTLSVAAEMALQIAQGMQHGIRKVPGLVHRDLKPANVLIDRQGQPRITDFGLVCASEKDAGTPAYMAPEQWRAGELTPQTDIYAYGCILYEMFTGHRLYPAATVQEWRQAHLERQPFDPCKLNRDLPEELGAFLNHCLGKCVSDRPPNWDAVVDFMARWFHRFTGQPVVLEYSPPELSAREFISSGYSFYQLRKTEEALEAFDKALNIDSANVDALTGKAVALLGVQKGRLTSPSERKEVLALCERAIEMNPKVTTAWIAKGLALAELGHHEHALAAYDQALEIDTDDSSALLNKAIVLVDLGRHGEATAVIERALEIDPGNVDAWALKGSTLADFGCFEEALATCERILEIDPENPNANATVLRACDQALEVDPKDVGALRLKGQALFNFRRLEEAFVTFERALEIDPENEKVKVQQQLTNKYWKSLDSLADTHSHDLSFWIQRGRNMLQRGHTDLALFACDRAIAIDPDSFDAWFANGDVLGRCSEWTSALTSFEKALAFQPGNTTALYAKGYCLYQMYRKEDALAVFERILEIDPKHEKAKLQRESAKRLPSSVDDHHEKSRDEPDAWVEKGAAEFWQHGQTGKAIWAYNRAIAIDPNNVVAWRRKGKLLEGAWDYAAALLAIERVLTLEPDSARDWNDKGNCLFSLDRKEEALAAYQRVLELDPCDVSDKNMASILTELGRKDEITEMRRIVDRARRPTLPWPRVFVAIVLCGLILLAIYNVVSWILR